VQTACDCSCKGSESGKAEAVTAEVGGFQLCATVGEPQMKFLMRLGVVHVPYRPGFVGISIWPRQGANTLSYFVETPKLRCVFVAPAAPRCCTLSYPGPPGDPPLP